jgi:hypothetical protein
MKQMLQKNRTNVKKDQKGAFWGNLVAVSTLFWQAKTKNPKSNLRIFFA